MVSRGVDEGGAPGLVLRQVGLIPRAFVVRGPVELEREDAGLARGRAAICHANRFYKASTYFEAPCT